MFDEFEQLDPSRSTEGTGLGLSLTKRLVDLHGGIIDVESAYGAGSVFNVYMPVAAPEIVVEEKPVIQEVVPAFSWADEDSPLVLVVEDDLPYIRAINDPSYSGRIQSCPCIRWDRGDRKGRGATALCHNP